jgi:hypothetical protein
MNLQPHRLTGVTLAVSAALLLTLVPTTPAQAAVEPAVEAAVEACADAARAPFRDVADGSTHAASVDCLLWLELTRGVAHDRFGTGEAVSRAQVATFLDRMVTLATGPLDDPATPRFEDLHGVHAPAIERLAAAGIIDGRTATRFEPDDPVRRDQLASMLVRTHDVLLGADAPGDDLGDGDGEADGERDPTDGSADADAHDFTDIGGNVHEAGIATAAALGLVNGRAPGIFEPAVATTRGQMALVITRLLDRVDGGADVAVTGPTGFRTRTTAVPASLRALMHRWTWRPGCPVPISDLRLLEVVHTDLQDTRRWGALVVHRDVVTDLEAALGELDADGFRIARMEPVEHFRGSDDASMAANNTSAFNCRQVTGGTRFSDHSYGRAIDINPVQNPYVRGSTVLPDAGRGYLDRSDVRPGMLLRPGGVDAFDRIGWGWGGDYATLKDYQHLSLTGR